MSGSLRVSEKGSVYLSGMSSSTKTLECITNQLSVQLIHHSKHRNILFQPITILRMRGMFGYCSIEQISRDCMNNGSDESVWRQHISEYVILI